MRNIFSEKSKKFFFCGIGGIFMSALAEYFFKNGYTVFGSDKKPNDNTLRLERAGIKVFHTHNANNVIGADYFVYTSAILSDNPELIKARELGIPLIKRSELLGRVLSCYDKSVAVAGSHGKTTSTAMITHVLEKGNLSPTAFIGGRDITYGNLKIGDKKIVVTEACEYKKNFLDIKPDITVILNVDNDHLESYGSFSEEIKSFREFSKDSVCVINADDDNFFEVCPENYITYGIKNAAKYQAKNVRDFSGGCAFTVYYCNKRLGRIKLKTEGKHNVYNALSVIAVARFLGVDFSDIVKGLEEFSGVERRNEYIGKIEGIPCYADYAHHPTEIAAYLNSLKNADKTLIVFEPHTYSRTENLMSEFVRVLSRCNRLVIHKTFPAREKYDKKGSAFTLFENLIKRGVKVKYAENFNDVIRTVRENKDIERISILGAGDLYFAAKNRAKAKDKNKL